MEKIISALSENKGIFIGVIAGIIKALNSVRSSKINWAIICTDLTASPLVGYATWHLATLSGELALWEVILLTVFMSLSVFVITSLMTDVEIAKKLIAKWIKDDK